MSTVDDLLLWDRDFYGNKLGKDTLLHETLFRGVLNNGEKIEYAMGLRVSYYRGLPIIEHGGALFGYRTELVRFPEQKFSVITLCNLDNSDPKHLAYEVANLYLDGLYTDKPLPPAAHVDTQPSWTSIAI